MTDGPQDGEGNSIWERLRRRKVVQWGLAYAAGTWGLLQGLQFLAEAFDWPSRVLKLGTVAALLGLPLAIALAWFRGERGAQRASRTELAVVTLLFLLGGGLFWYYQRSTPASDPLGPAASSLDPAAATPAADAGTSIAVLPFDNRSASADDAYFVDGIHDDILTQLSKVSALKVISRTSVEQFRDTKLPIKEIASQLGVKSILEGGVQRGGDRVRINVQLIDASTDAHLWAETYDRELTAENIFAIQSEVAAAIAGALKATLTAGEKARMDAVPTQNLDAWENYQLGRQRMARRTTQSLVEAEQFFRKAIELDPGFALAYVGLADSLSLQAFFGGKPSESTLAEAEHATSRALALDQSLAEAWTSKAQVASTRGDNRRAEELFRKAIELNPNYATAHQWFGTDLTRGGRPKEGLEHLERAVELDPLSAMINVLLGESLASNGRFDGAAARFDRAIQIDPANPWAYMWLAWLNAYARNRYVDAVQLGERALALDPESPMSHAWFPFLWLDLNDKVQARELTANALRRWPDDHEANAAAALMAISLGDSASAERHARKALAQIPRDARLLSILDSAEFLHATPANSRARYASVFPELLDPAGPRIDPGNIDAAIQLAAVLQKMGEPDQAATLLDASERTLGSMPRLGLSGFGIADVEIHALRGDKAKALAKLREAAKAGWRDGWRYFRDIDPKLVSIRDDPEFRAAFADIERDMARQRAELAKRPKNAPLSVEAAAR